MRYLKFVDVPVTLCFNFPIRILKVPCKGLNDGDGPAAAAVQTITTIAASYNTLKCKFSVN